MVNRHLSSWSMMGSSEFEYNTDLFEEKWNKREQINEEFEKRVVDGYISLVKEFADKQDIVKIDSLLRNGIKALIERFG